MPGGGAAGAVSGPPTLALRSLLERAITHDEAGRREAAVARYTEAATQLLKDARGMGTPQQSANRAKALALINRAETLKASLAVDRQRAADEERVQSIRREAARSVTRAHRTMPPGVSF